jgi:type IV secretion system protein VirB8
MRRTSDTLSDSVAADQSARGRGDQTVSATMREPGIEAYLAEARSWDRDRIEQARRSQTIAWRTAGGAVVCALASTVALMSLVPLKKVEPYVIRVDNSTGIVDVVPAYDGHASLNEAVTRYFLSHYVTVCERFNFATAESDYEECGAFHNAQRNQIWSALWNRNNVNSPLNLHRDGSTVTVEVTEVSLFERSGGVTDTAQIRYVKLEQAGSGAPTRSSHWLATVQYALAPAALDPKVRRWNPLGFKVMSMVSESEVVPEAPVGPR